MTASSSNASVLTLERGENPSSDRIEDDTVLVIGMGNWRVDQNSLSGL